MVPVVLFLTGGPASIAGQNILVNGGGVFQ
jgi:hypothetical protein